MAKLRNKASTPGKVKRRPTVGILRPIKPKKRADYEAESNLETPVEAEKEVRVLEAEDETEGEYQVESQKENQASYINAGPSSNRIDAEPGYSSLSNPKRKRKKRGLGQSKQAENYRTYIHKVLKQVHPDTGISLKAMGIMNSFLNDILDKIAGEAVNLSQFSKKNTVAAREIQTAARLILPGELGRLAVNEGTKAVSNFVSNKP
ncbi:hypothetical protein R1flu_022089 [Riccia fluitans]|uniref:Core Histone H2A/H2B/H3 domain-containing protein n=1 Tax=Riccia fluitans TaxID=41844 RepID=A0ABD1ZSP1_9MARC